MLVLQLQSGVSNFLRGTPLQHKHHSRATISTASSSVKMASPCCSLKVPHVMSVAGSDSGGGAGIQADLKACAALGVFCSTVITAVTAQNSQGVQGIDVMSEDIVTAQLESVLSDMDVDVVKTGMLPSENILRALCAKLKEHPVHGLVVDPVMVATSGDELVSPTILGILCDELIPIASIVTPNLKEASRLIGGEPVTTVSDMQRAAKIIHKLGSRYVLVKGGHLENFDEVTDVLYDGNRFHELCGPRLKTRNTHGTGCTLASSIAAEMAKGASMELAVRRAREYVQQTLRKSSKLSIGRGPQGTMNHFSRISSWEHVSPRLHFKPQDLLLYAITDSGMNKKWQRSTSEAVRAAIKGGATIIQLREKIADTGDFLQEAFSCLSVTREYGIPLIINDRVDIAMACDADGVHVGQSDIPVPHVRDLLGPDKIIGISCKTEKQVEEAMRDGADYIGSGGIFPTNTKKDNLTIGLSGLRAVCQASSIPVVAIGGINASNVQQVWSERPARLHGVAVVSALFDKPEVEKETRQLCDFLVSHSCV